MRNKTPTVLIGGWRVEDLSHAAGEGLYRAASAEQAVARALELAAAPVRPGRNMVMLHDGPPGGSSARKSNRASPEQEVLPEVADLWRAYDLALQHYQADLELFSTRMSLFLLIESALVALVGSGKVSMVNPRDAAYFGLALTVAWSVSATGSYMWIKTWRAHMLKLGGDLEERTRVAVSVLNFQRSRRHAIHGQVYGHQYRQRFWKQLEFLTWYVRPTFVFCCVPLVFMAGWIYLAVHA